MLIAPGPYRPTATLSLSEITGATTTRRRATFHLPNLFAHHERRPSPRGFPASPAPRVSIFFSSPPATDVVCIDWSA